MFSSYHIIFLYTSSPSVVVVIITFHTLKSTNKIPSTSSVAIYDMASKTVFVFMTTNYLYILPLPPNHNTLVYCLKTIFKSFFQLLCCWYLSVQYLSCICCVYLYIPQQLSTCGHHQVCTVENIILFYNIHELMLLLLLLFFSSLHQLYFC